MTLQANRPITEHGDAPSLEFAAFIQALVARVEGVEAANTALTTRVDDLEAANTALAARVTALETP